MTPETRLAAADVDTAAIDSLERQAAEGALVVARFDPRSTARIGDAVEATVSVEDLHFFDPATGARIVDEPRSSAPSSPSGSPAAGTSAADPAPPTPTPPPDAATPTDSDTTAPRYPPPPPPPPPADRDTPAPH